MERPMRTEPKRDPRFLEMYRGESARMRCPPDMEAAPQKQTQTPMRDSAVILPLLLLLMTEGADRYLLLALLYILM